MGVCRAPGPLVAEPCRAARPSCPRARPPPLPSCCCSPKPRVPRSLPRVSSTSLLLAAGPCGTGSSPPAPSKDDVERCKQKDLLEQMMAEMVGEFPDLHRTIVSERDIYLTYMLRQAARRLELPRSSDGDGRAGRGLPGARR